MKVSVAPGRGGAWRIDQREIAAEQQVLGHELYQKARPRIAEHIARVWSAGTAEDLYQAHRQLLIEFLARQTAMGEELPRLRAEQNAILRELVRRQAKPVDEIKPVQARLDRLREMDRVHDAVQHVIRQVTDALAWRALQFDRRIFAVLGQGRRVGRLSSGPGLDAELGVLGKAWEDGRLLAIHNDMTNCLRHGDLTAVRFRPNGVEVTVNEVKIEGASVDRAQTRRLTEAVELLRDGRHTTASGGRPIRIVNTEVDLASEVAVLPGLIARARNEMMVWERVAPWLIVGAADLTVVSRDPQGSMDKVRRYREDVGWGRRPLFRFSFGERRMRDRRASSSYLAPLTILPLSTEDMTDAVLGYVEIFTLLDLEALVRELASLGIRAGIATPPLSERVFLLARVGDRTVAVPPELREQLLVELISVENVAAAVEAVIREAEAGMAPGEAAIVVQANEWRVWWRALGIVPDVAT